MATALQAIKPGRAAESSEICGEMISANREMQLSMMMELCQCVFD